MKYRMWTFITAIALLAALAVPVRHAAQEQNQDLPRYTVIDLGTLGGTFSWGGGINNEGLVEGYSILLDGNLRAFLWRNGVMKDLGTLGGPNSAAALLPSRPSESAEVGGGSDTTTPDPNGEDYCGFGTYLECRPFLWRDGVMTPLPLLGGNNGVAGGVNNRGQVVGQAEYDTPDPTCVLPGDFLRVGPVVWENGEIKKFHMFPGDTDAGAWAINDMGQATGGSGTCSNSFHAVLWQDGTAIDLGNLGGTTNNYGVDINNQGQVVGISDLRGDTTYHGFLWEKGVMTDLGTLPGDVASTGDGINIKGQVVGGSYDEEGNGRAFLWQNGVMTDLNTLIPADSPLFLIGAFGKINDQGQIAGYALQISTGEVHAFLATPTTERWPINESPTVVLPDDVRNLLEQHRRFGRPFGGGFIRPQ
jgi:probable HAF family extracellular repeat protein